MFCLKLTSTDLNVWMFYDHREKILCSIILSIDGKIVMFIWRKLKQLEYNYKFNKQLKMLQLFMLLKKQKEIV